MRNEFTLTITLFLLTSTFADDAKIKEMRQHMAKTRQLKRSTMTIKKNLAEIRNQMLMSGVIEESMIGVVDMVL